MKTILNEKIIKNYFESKFNEKIEILEFGFVGEGYYANGYKVVYKVGDGIKKDFVRVVKSLNSGHEYPIDRAVQMIVSKEISDNIANALKIYDIAGFDEKGAVHSVAKNIEYFSIGEFIEESNFYTADMEKIVKKKKVDKDDIERCLRLSDYLVDIHKNKFLGRKDGLPKKIELAKSLYKRTLREVISNNELTLGILDIDWKEKDWGAGKQEIYGFIADALVYKESLKNNYERLGRIHGDFWDKNILFQGEKMIASDTSRFIWGEPAIDIAALVARYMNFDLVNFGSLDGPFNKLTKVFIENYLDKTKDEELLKIMPYAFVFYVIVSSHPAFHPELSIENRKTWINIGKNILKSGLFDWNDQNKYIK